MSLERKFSQLKNSPEFSLDSNWEKTTKHELLSEIHAQNRLMKAQTLTAGERFDLVAMKITRRLLPSTAKVVAGFLIIMLGTGTTLAAQAAVPGEPLWPVKRSIEKAELTLAINPVRETEIHIKHVNTRLNEIDKIVGNGNQVSPEKVAQKEKAIKQVVRHLEKDVAAVDSTLKIVKEEKKAIETVNLVKKVKDVAKETKQKVVTLENTVSDGDANNQIIGEALSNVKKINDVVTETVVNIAVELHEEAVAKEIKTIEATTTTPRSTELLVVSEKEQTEIQAVKNAAVEIINDEINELSGEIQVSKDKIVTNENKEDSSAATKQEISSVKEKTEQAASVLGEAKVLLDSGSVKDAANKILTSKEINKQAEVGLKQLDKPVETKEITPVNSTSTKPIVPVQTSSTTTSTVQSASLPELLEDLLDAKEVESAEAE